jgi:hypothetical protein
MVCQQEDETLAHATSAAQNGTVLLGWCHFQSLECDAGRSEIQRTEF